MKLKSILTKTIVTIALALVGVVAINNTNNDVQAAIVKNDVRTYKVYTKTAVYNKYQNGKKTGQVLAANTNWKVIKTAYDAKGNKWYDLGKNQWVKVVIVKATSQAPKNTATTMNNSTSYTSKATGSEAGAKAWIAGRESGGSYSARNGQYIGKYQLSASYLGGDYSAANQERVADNYVKSRYGSWTAAKSFWQANGWY